MTGNTKALIENIDVHGFDVFNLHYIEPDKLNINKYETILIGTSTIGDGVPHQYFKSVQHKLMALEGKRIGLFGSGNSIYKHYCGALDLLEDFLRPKNQILFKFKFESYPTEDVKRDFQRLINEVCKIETT